MTERKMPIGAEIVQEGVHFRVWAPKCKTIDVVIDQKKYPLRSEENGYFSGLVKEAHKDTLYHFVLNSTKIAPDPASRFQPQGPDGPSQVMDSGKFKWTDGDWRGIVEQDKVVIYELHIGTFTKEGTWASAAKMLPYLQGLGITIVQMMPVAEFPGQFNWGYDGVDLFAPTHNYGTPDDLRAFINHAHELGVGVILDVVYNHFGPKGNYIELYSDSYFKEELTEWGRMINFDEKGSHPVREFMISNAGYWIEEFHFDGLRLDACHSIQDNTTPHILLEISKKVREKAGSRKTFITAENEHQQVVFVLLQEKGGYELNALFNEDFHHSAFVRLTGHNEGYFSDYTGSAQEFLSSIKHNFLYQGQWYRWQEKRRGTLSFGMPPSHFVIFLENHDQVANTGSAERLHLKSQPGVFRAMTTLLLLSPQIPLLFQGQEYGSMSPFYYFCDSEGELAQQIYAGRLEFISQFNSFDDPAIRKRIPFPSDKSTFLKSKLKWNEKEQGQAHYLLHKDLLEMRKNDPVFSHFSECQIEGAVLNNDLILLRYFSPYGERLLLINFGLDFAILPANDPLLAPPNKCFWKEFWSSEAPEYGGFGYRKIPKNGNWTITGNSASILRPEK